MKRMTSLIVCVLILALISGCDSTKQSSESSTPQEPSSASTGSPIAEPKTSDTQASGPGKEVSESPTPDFQESVSSQPIQSAENAQENEPESSQNAVENTAPSEPPPQQEPQLNVSQEFGLKEDEPDAITGASPKRAADGSIYYS